MKQHIIEPVVPFIVFCLIFNSCLKESSIYSLQDTVIVAKIYQPDGLLGKDAVIESMSPDENLGNSEHMSILSWTNGGLLNTSRALIRFDLSEISSQTTISSAKLSLYGISYGNLEGHIGENDFTIYRVLQEWNESYITWNNQPSVTNTDSVVVQESSFADQSYLDIDVTQIIQYQINNPAENYGFMLKLNEEFPYKAVVLASSDYFDNKKRPKLVVFY